MGYAVRNDGVYGWRSVDSSADCLGNEEYSAGEPAPYLDPNASIDAQILALEATVTRRRLREAALTEAGRAWLADLDAQIAVLRAQRV